MEADTAHHGDVQRALRADADILAGELIALRHELHRCPEVGLRTPVTQSIVLRELADSHLAVTTGEQLTSVVAVLHGAAPGPVVILRADMDALAIAERSDEMFAADSERATHACGHDIHTAALVGAARLLAAQREQLSGTVVFMFQPGSEAGNGAALMVEEGVLEAAGRPATCLFAVHAMASAVPAGLVAIRSGAMLAGLDQVEVIVQGRGGHAAMPHLAADPVPVLAELVLALHQLADRGFDPFDPAIIAVTRVQAGCGGDTIADSARLTAVVRAYSAQAKAAAQERIVQLCTGIAGAYGMWATVDYREVCPVTVNSPVYAEKAHRVAAELFGDDQVLAAPVPLPGVDDCAHLLDLVPGCDIVLGAMPRDVDPLVAGFNHSPTARFDDAVVPKAALLLAALAANELAGAAQ